MINLSGKEDCVWDSVSVWGDVSKSVGCAWSTVFSDVSKVWYFVGYPVSNFVSKKLREGRVLSD